MFVMSTNTFVINRQV